EHVGDRRGSPGHLEADVETLLHPELAHRGAEVGACRVDEEVGAGPLRQLEAGVGQVGHRDVAGADVAGDGGSHDADRAGAGDDDVLPGEGEGEGRVHGIAQRVEDRSEVGVDPVVVDPGIGRGDDDVVGEGAIPVHPDADRVDAQVPAACPAVATGAAHQVPLTGDAVTDGDVGDR